MIGKGDNFLDGQSILIGKGDNVSQLSQSLGEMLRAAKNLLVLFEAI